MDLNKKEKALLDKYIQMWRADGIIDELQSNKMLASINERTTNLKTLTTFAFIIAGCSAILAVISIIFEAKFITWLQEQFDFAEITIGCLFGSLSVFLAFISKKYHHKFSTFSRESINIATAITLAIGMTYIGRSQNWNETYFPALCGIAALIYFIYAYWLNSKILWAIALLTTTGWYTTQLFVAGGETYSFLGLNFAVTSTIWGIIVWTSATLFTKRFAQFRHTQNLIGILLTLFAAWTLSIFGNYNSYEAWEVIRQGKLWYWALFYSIILIALTFYGVKRDKDYIRDIAMSFFILNIYTRYFEYFWDKTHKGIFFAILAISFYFVGRQFDKIRKRTASNI